MVPNRQFSDPLAFNVFCQSISVVSSTLFIMRKLEWWDCILEYWVLKKFDNCVVFSCLDTAQHMMDRQTDGQAEILQCIHDFCWSAMRNRLSVTTVHLTMSTVTYQHVILRPANLCFCSSLLFTDAHIEFCSTLQQSNCPGTLSSPADYITAIGCYAAHHQALYRVH